MDLEWLGQLRDVEFHAQRHRVGFAGPECIGRRDQPAARTPDQGHGVFQRIEALLQVAAVDRGAVLARQDIVGNAYGLRGAGGAFVEPVPAWPADCDFGGEIQRDAACDGAFQAGVQLEIERCSQPVAFIGVFQVGFDDLDVGCERRSRGERE